jgi:hypothetical protein
MLDFRTLFDFGGLFGPRRRTVATVGLSGHGKTVFLAGLFWDSFFSLAETFREDEHRFAVRAVNTKADDVFYGNARLLHELSLPPANPRSADPQPAVLEFLGVPSLRSGKRGRVWLTFYDVAGEVFATDEAALADAKYLQHADDIIFLFDPTQPDFSALSAARLVDRVCRVVPGCERRNLIIALSKMDELRLRDDWIDLIGDYWPGHAPSAGGLEGYFVQMESLSDRFRDWWTFPERGAHSLIASLPKQTRFCGVSSLGHRPRRDQRGIVRLVRKPEPFRVRDPLFWIFRAARVM